MGFIHFLFLWSDKELDQELFVGIFFIITKQKVCDKRPTIIQPFTKNLPISFAPGFSMGTLFSNE